VTGPDGADRPAGDRPLDDDDLAWLAASLDAWLGDLLAQPDHVLAVDRDPGDVPRWFVRMRGVDKEFTTIWLTLGQRTLRYETYVMPAPEERHAELFEHLLRRNERLTGARYSVGLEDAVYLRGEVFVEHVDRIVVDRIVGTLYDEVERAFQGLLRIGFASRFAG
jgi:hypothetical protein